MKNFLNPIIKTIVKEVTPKSIWLFGSRAKGKAAKNSDIDLCIIKDNVEDKINELSELRLILTKYPHAFDLIMMSEEEFEQRKHIWWTIQGQIYKNGKKLYKSA